MYLDKLQTSKLWELIIVSMFVLIVNAMPEPGSRQIMPTVWDTTKHFFFDLCFFR